MLSYNSIVAKISPSCPSCGVKLWVSKIKIDNNLFDEVDHWYQLSEKAKFCCSCNCRIRGNSNKNGFLFIFAFFGLPLITAFFKTNIFIHYGVYVKFLYYTFLILGVIWVLSNEKYTIYKPTKK